MISEWVIYSGMIFEWMISEWMISEFAQALSQSVKEGVSTFQQLALNVFFETAA